MAQSFVPNTGDAWTYTLDFLREHIARREEPPSPDAQDGSKTYLEFAERLGQRTAQLHVALASEDDDPAFAPEPITPEIIASWEQATITSASSAQVTLDRTLPKLPPGQQRLVATVELNSASLESRVHGYQQLSGTSCIRVHGDYHLGQVLRTADNDAVILDFEGEPSRPISERRRKTSAMKDVAGMLRSFRYARCATLKSYTGATPAPTVDQWLAGWEQQTRSAFLRGYRDEVARARVPLVPTDDASFEGALAAWELDKALYEISYEANNRPTWLDIPLSTITS
jgi:maltose alpha-D-glucosyltransferase/alpha-amylase